MMDFRFRDRPPEEVCCFQDARGNQVPHEFLHEGDAPAWRVLAGAKGEVRGGLDSIRGAFECSPAPGATQSEFKGLATRKRKAIF